MRYTHYSLFGADGSVVRYFARLPDGDLPELLAELHRLVLPHHPNSCCGIGDGALHPGGGQMSFDVAACTGGKFHVILFNKAALQVQFECLAAEGNDSSANSALAALRD